MQTAIKASASKGFTLVELIVVITILAILGTIGFISLQGYSANSRDAKRTNDLRALTTSLSTK
jgi:prepilin-type N-terminal cleavage/methylation domain-containing protein